MNRNARNPTRLIASGVHSRAYCRSPSGIQQTRICSTPNWRELLLTFFAQTCHSAPIELIVSNHISSVGPAGEDCSKRPPNMYTFEPIAVSVWPDLPLGPVPGQLASLMGVHFNLWCITFPYPPMIWCTFSSPHSPQWTQYPNSVSPPHSRHNAIAHVFWRLSTGWGADGSCAATTIVSLE